MPGIFYYYLSDAGYKDVYVIRDASRAAYIPGVGSFGSGFLTDPAALMETSTQHGIKYTKSPMMY